MNYEQAERLIEALSDIKTEIECLNESVRIIGKLQEEA